MTAVPEGFAPLFRTRPFLEAVGPFYYRRDGERLIIGLRILASTPTRAASRMAGC